DTAPVSTLVAVTVTPGINAFAASDTVPLRLALLDWLNAGAETRTSINSAPAVTDFRMFSSPSVCRNRGLYSAGSLRSMRASGAVQRMRTAERCQEISQG